MKPIVAIITYCLMQYTYTPTEKWEYDRKTGIGYLIEGGIEYKKVCDHQKSFSDSSEAIKAFRCVKADKDVSNVRLFWVQSNNK